MIVKMRLSRLEKSWNNMKNVFHNFSKMRFILFLFFTEQWYLRHTRAQILSYIRNEKCMNLKRKNAQILSARCIELSRFGIEAYQTLISFFASAKELGRALSLAPGVLQDVESHTPEIPLRYNPTGASISLAQWLACISDLLPSSCFSYSPL